MSNFELAQNQMAVSYQPLLKWSTVTLGAEKISQSLMMAFRL
jgi:hypothetical protein